MSTEADWPDDAPEEARALGELVALFRGGTAKFVIYLTVGVLALVLGAAAAVGLVMVFADAAPGQQLHGIGKLGMLAVLLIGAGAATLTKAFTVPGLRVFVCSGGLARQQRDKVEVLRWDEINKVVRRNNPQSQEFTISSPVQLVLTAAGGREWVLDERVSGLRELRELVEEHTLTFMLPPAVEAFAAGATIGFGEVSAGPEGIHHGRETLPWDLFDRAEAAQGRLVLYSRDAKKPFGRIDLAKVPNAHVLLALAEHARGPSGPEA